MSVKKFALHRQNVLTIAMDGLFKYNGNRTSDSRVLSAKVDLSHNHFLEHMRKRKMARYAKSQLLYLQMIMLKEDSSYARYIMRMQTTGLCYTTVT